jgi:hypothetical protein
VRHADFLEGRGPGGGGFGVDALLGFPGGPLGRVVNFWEGGNVGEAGDAVDGASAEVEGRSGRGVS